MAHPGGFAKGQGGRSPERWSDRWPFRGGIFHSSVWPRYIQPTWLEKDELEFPGVFNYVSRMDSFVRIKRLVIARHVLFTQKAEDEMAVDHLTPELVYESILNAPSIFKVLRSKNPRSGNVERLYVIKGLTFDGLDIYTKGKILNKHGVDVFYVLISSKKSTDI